MNKEQLAAWKNSEVTREAFKVLEKQQDELKHGMAYGTFINTENATETLAKACWIVGTIEGIDKILQMEVDDA